MLEKITQTVLVLTSVAIVAILINDRRTPVWNGLEVGDSLEELQVVDQNGAPLNLATKETMVVFFSSTCVYCVSSIPAYAEVVSTNCDLTLAVTFIDLEGPEMSDWWDEHGRGVSGCGQVMVGSLTGSVRDYGVRSTPTHVLLDSDLVVRELQIGEMNAVPSWLAS